jgi:hypothetical protein
MFLKYSKVLLMFKVKTTELDDEFVKKFRLQNEQLLIESLNTEEEVQRKYSKFSVDIENPFKVIKKELSDLINIYEELGVWSLSHAYVESVKTIKKSLETCKHIIGSELIENIGESINKSISYLIRKLIADGEENDVDKILRNSSEKVNCLVDIFKTSLTTNKFHAIVFVERKHTAYYLDQILQKISKLEEFKFIRSDFVFGNSRQNIKEFMNNSKQVSLGIEI